MTDDAPLKAAADAIAPGRISALRVTDGIARIVFDVGAMSVKARAAAEQALKAVIGAQPGIVDVRIAMTADTVRRRILAVASGKGGVGKSTVSANLAIALARAGRQVGLVDADIYGPSQPTLLGTGIGRPQADIDSKKLIPVASAFGVPLLSMGQLAPPDQAIAWRGPMASGALGQLIDAEWGATDLLVVDMPPGTGDIQLTMVQKHKPAGALIVTTPQDLALIDARRAIALFTQAGVPIIGLVENMAGYLCPHCHETSAPFGSGGGEAAARDLGLPFLGRIPLALAIRERSDAGMPPAAAGGDGADDPAGAPFHRLAAAVGDWLDANP